MHIKYFLLVIGLLCLELHAGPIEGGPGYANETRSAPEAAAVGAQAVAAQVKHNRSYSDLGQQPTPAVWLDSPCGAGRVVVSGGEKNTAPVRKLDDSGGLVFPGGWRP